MQQDYNYISTPNDYTMTMVVHNNDYKSTQHDYNMTILPPQTWLYHDITVHVMTIPWL